NNEFVSFDGSFALQNSRGLIYKDGVAANFTLNSSGVTGQTLTDTNGNSISCTFSQGAITGCTDTVGRHITFTTDPSSGVPLSMTYQDSSGTSRSITFQYAHFVPSYPFGSGACVISRPTFAAPGPLLLTSVTLPNNLTYRFDYYLNPDGTTT